MAPFTPVWYDYLICLPRPLLNRCISYHLHVMFFWFLYLTIKHINIWETATWFYINSSVYLLFFNFKWYGLPFFSEICWDILIIFSRMVSLSLFLFCCFLRPNRVTYGFLGASVLFLNVVEFYHMRILVEKKKH